MKPEIILDIVLSSLLGIIQFLAYLTCIIWRIKKFRKGLHYSAAGIAGLLISVFFGVFLPIGGFTFLDGGTAGTKSLITGIVFCPLILPFAIRGMCFCVFIDGTYVVERTLFSETRIDLTNSETFIDDSKPFTIAFWISIVSGENRAIQFNSKRIEGDLASFLKDCKRIQNKK